MTPADIVDIAVRAFCKRDDQKYPISRDYWDEDHQAVSQRPEVFIAFDTEAATSRTPSMPGFDNDRWDWRTQNLLFGGARLGTTADMAVTDEIIFYLDDLPEYGRAVLERYVAENSISLQPAKFHSDGRYIVKLPEREKAPLPELRWRDEPAVSVWLMPLSEFLKEFFRIAYLKRALIIGFNLPFDLCRISSRWGISKSKRNSGGWSLTPWVYTDENGRIQKNPFRPNITVKKSGPRRSFMAFTNCRGDDNQTS